MPRPERLEFNGAWYHVENYGRDGRNIFYDDDDRQMFLDLLGEVSQIFSLEVHAYSLMDDEVHLIVRTPYANLASAMRHVNGVYTQNFNKAWNEQGSVFGGRYRARLFEAKEHLLNFVVYVHSLPVEEEICRHAREYAWTSHRAYFDNHRPRWLHTETVMKKLGTVKAQALAKLALLVKNGVDDGFHQLLARERIIIGGDGFKTQAQRTPVGRTPVGQTPVAQAILNFVAQAYDVPISVLTKSEPGIDNEARRMAVYQLRKVAGLQQKEIAKHLGNANPYTIAKSLQRFHDRLEVDDSLYEKTVTLTEKMQTRLRN